MNYSNLRNSLDSNTVNLNDRFNRAQWKFSPPDLDEEISKDIHMGMQNKVNNVLYQLLGYNTRDINYLKATTKRDPICVMFEHMKSRQMESCPIFCSNPDTHFDEKKCYPLYKVYQVLKKIDENAAKHLLKEEFRKMVLKSVNDEEKLMLQSVAEGSHEKIYSIFSLPDHLNKTGSVKKKVVLVIDFLDSEVFSKEDEEIFYTGLNNLLENVNENFTCMLSPALKLKEEERWANFLSDQIKNCHMVVVVFSPRMVDKLTDVHSIGVNDEALSSTSISYADPLKYLWSSVTKSRKPVAGIVFEESLAKSVSSLMPVIFYLPKNMKLMLGYLIHRLQKL